MAEYITKKVPTYTTFTDESGNKSKVKTGEKEVSYRIDAGFIPTKLDDISIEFIINYCEANNQAGWLYEKLTTKVPCKVKATGETKLRDIPFVKLRGDFVDTYFSDSIQKKGKKSNPTTDFLKKYAKKK